MSKHRVVITGVGACSPLGHWDDFKRGLREGSSALQRVPLFQRMELRSQVAGCVDDSLVAPLLSEKKLRNRSRASLFAISAAQEALTQSRFCPRSISERERADTCVVLGSGGGGIDIMEREYELFFRKKSRQINPFSIPASLVGILSSEVSIYFGFTGLSHVVTSGCTSSTDAMGQAYYMVQSGIVRRAVAGGVDACLTPGIITAFDRMGIISRKYNERPREACRPFSLDRDGFVPGEGAWVFLFERMEDALKRGAPIRAEVSGYGANCEAGHRVRMSDDGVWPALAMKSALDCNGLNANDVSYLSLHGTGTRLNDVVETRAVKKVFGDRRVPGSAPKSMMGHPQGASGAMGVAATLAGMEDYFFPPTINLEKADADCDLDYIPNRSREGSINIALCNCIGFGSRNAALVIKNLQD